MIDFVLDFQFNTWLAVGLYWIPLFLCLVGYSVRTWKDYQKDIDKITVAKHSISQYSVEGSLTVGSIIGRVIGSVTPGLNLICLIFSIGYGMLCSIGELLADFFSISIAGSYKPKKD